MPPHVRQAVGQECVLGEQRSILVKMRMPRFQALLTVSAEAAKQLQKGGSVAAQHMELGSDR